MPKRRPTARRARASAAARYQPAQIAVLLVAQAPPNDLGRYFYFEEVTEHDWLFRGVVRAVLEVEPSRAEKRRQLAELKRVGVFLIDLKPDPVEDDSDLAAYVPALVDRCRALKPTRIILIKTDVYDAAYAALAAAGLPVVNERVPFPSSGQQTRSLVAMRRAFRAPPLDVGS